MVRSSFDGRRRSGALATRRLRLHRKRQAAEPANNARRAWLSAYRERNPVRPYPPLPRRRLELVVSTIRRPQPDRPRLAPPRRASKPRIVIRERRQADDATGFVVRHSFPRLMPAAASLKFLETRAHRRVAEQRGEFLVDGIDRLRMGRSHMAMVRALENEARKGCARRARLSTHTPVLGNVPRGRLCR